MGCSATCPAQPVAHCPGRLVPSGACPMSTSVRSPRLARVLGMTVALALLAGLAPARADLIFFKDGFVLQGKVLRESTSVFESGQMIQLDRDSFFVDDYARCIFFSRLHVQTTEKKD